MSTNTSLQGGYGALMFHLRYPTIFRAASAFAPISNPTHAPWGIKAFNGYLSGGIAEGQNTYDPTELLGKVEQDALPGVKVLVDYGAADQFYVGRQLLPENLEEAARKKGILGNQVVVRKQDGYDHRYVSNELACSRHRGLTRAIVLAVTTLSPPLHRSISAGTPRFFRSRSNAKT